MRKGSLNCLPLAVSAKVCKDEPGEEEYEEEVEPEISVEVRPDPLPLEPEEACYHWVLQQMPEKETLNIISLRAEKCTCAPCFAPCTRVIPSLEAQPQVANHH